MKITKRQLRRIIREMKDKAGQYEVNGQSFDDLAAAKKEAETGGFEVIDTSTEEVVYEPKKLPEGTKITKKQLRRIIKEEKRKLLRESVTDMVDFEIMVEEAVDTLSAQFADSMYTLMDEDPEMFKGPDAGDVRSTPEEWEQQVQAAQQEMAERLTIEINRTMSQVEDQLHGGDFHTGNAPGGRFSR